MPDIRSLREQIKPNRRDSGDGKYTVNLNSCRLPSDRLSCLLHCRGRRDDRRPLQKVEVQKEDRFGYQWSGLR